MYNNPYFQNPYVGVQMPQEPKPESNLIRVTGLDGARAYQMAPNSTVALFDAGEDYMYVKSTDGAGFPTIRTFRFEPVDQVPTVNTDFISRREFEQYKEEVRAYVEQSIPTKSGKSTSKKSDSTAE